MRLCAFIALVFASVACAFDVPPATGHVVDQAGVLDGTARARLEANLRQVKSANGIEVAVLIVRTLGGEPVESAAQAAFDAWKPGRSGQDKGLLMLVAVEDRKVRLQPGYGLEGDLPDGKLGRILDEQVLPHFKAGDWLSGIRGGLATALKEAGAVLPDGAPAPRRAVRRERELSGVELMMLLGLVGFLGLGSIYSPALRFLLLHMLLSGRGGQSGRSEGGGDFGGFGGGSSGGGGASRGW